MNPQIDKLWQHYKTFHKIEADDPEVKHAFFSGVSVAARIFYNTTADLGKTAQASAELAQAEMTKPRISLQ